MKLQDLVRRFPLIWHATFAGGMESILRTSLRCATSLLAAAGLERDAKVFRGDTRRVSVATQTVVLRDQLRHRRDPTPSLDGITAAEWWALINARVYFFTRQKHLHHLVTKYSGLGKPQDVLTLDTGRLLASVVDRVEVTTVNAGAFPRKKGPTRGRSTFIPLSEFDENPTAIREVTVVGDVLIPKDAIVAIEHADRP